MEYRRANLNDVDAFLQNRIEFVESIRNIADISTFEKETRAYLEAHIGTDDLLVFLALDNGEIIASCMACVFTTAPLPNYLSGKSAELLNVFTKREYRRRGLATKLLTLMLGELKSAGVETVVLKYTEDGRTLYENLGFTLLKKQMQLCL